MKLTAEQHARFDRDGYLFFPGMFSAAEWGLTDASIQWGWPLAAALAYIAVGPAIIAYRSWGLGVQRVGPNMAGFFANLTPAFAALSLKSR